MTKWLLLLLLAASWLAATPLSAQQPPSPETMSCSGQAASPARTVIECAPGFATARDRLTIYHKAPAASDDWRQRLDQQAAIWVFEAGATGRASLVIDFSRGDQGLVAQLFDDSDGDGAVSLLLAGDDPPTVTESQGRWTVRVAARDGWWQRDAMLNFNLELRVNGPVQGMIDTVVYRDQLKNDNRDDLEIFVRDNDGDGRPDYEWRQAYPPLPESSAIYRTAIMANTRDDEIAPTGSLFWPLLGSVPPPGFIRPYGQKTNPAPIQVDWSRSRIVSIGEFVASRGKPGNFFVYSINRIGPGLSDQANFENPFVFYDLAQANDGWSDLSIRSQYFNATDIYADIAKSYEPGEMPESISEIQYTWDQYHRQQWDYQLSLAGFYHFDQTIAFPDFSIKSVPPEQFPQWVTGRTWLAATLVQAEKPYWNNEHIYEWTTTTAGGKLWAYLFGQDPQSPAHRFATIPEGFRGEYALEFNEQPYVYISPVDRKLHLLKAHAGVWSISPTLELRVANLDGDAYLDQWSETRLITGSAPLTETRQLNLAAGHALYGGGGEVSLVRQVLAPATFTTLAPATHDEWRTLGEELERVGPALPPGDVRAMLGQFDGPRLDIRGAALSAYRPLPGGFRAILTLEPGFTAQGGLLSLRGVAPGSYVLRLAGELTLTPLTPAQISGRIVSAGGDYLRQSPVVLALENAGLTDVPQARLELSASLAGGPPTAAATATLDLLASAPLTATLAWVPDAPGAWTLLPRLRLPDGSALELPAQQVTVAGGRLPSAESLIAVSSTGASAPAIAFLLLGFMLLAGIGIWMFWHMPNTEQVDDAV